MPVSRRQAFPQIAGSRLTLAIDGEGKVRVDGRFTVEVSYYIAWRHVVMFA